MFGEWLVQVFEDASLPVRVPVFGSLLGLYFGDAAPTDYAGAKHTDEALYEVLPRLPGARRGLRPGAPRGALPGLAHSKDELEAGQRPRGRRRPRGGRHVQCLVRPEEATSPPPGSVAGVQRAGRPTSGP